MPYDPKAVTEDQRSYAYKMMWLGLPNAIILLVSLQFEAFEALTMLAGGFVSGSFIGLIWAWSNDEFVRGQIAFAANWALAFVGVALFVLITPFMRDVQFPAAQVLAATGLVFHAALVFRRLRDGALSEENA